MSDQDDYLARAESILTNYSGASLVSDEAYLLRGCLYALVAIARQQYAAGHPAEGGDASH